MGQQEKPSKITLAGAGVIFIGFVVSLLPIFLTWGKSENSDDGRNFIFTSWSVKYEVSGEKWDQSWDDVCPRAKEATSLCSTVKACRAFSFTTPAFALAAAGVSVMGYKAEEKCPVQIGVGMGMFSVISSGVGIAMGYMFIADVNKEVGTIDLDPKPKVTVDIAVFLFMAAAGILFIAACSLIVGLFQYDESYGQNQKKEKKAQQAAMQQPPAQWAPGAQNYGQPQPQSQWGQQAALQAQPTSGGWGQQPQQAAPAAGQHGGWGQQPMAQTKTQPGGWQQQQQQGAGRAQTQGGWGQQPQGGWGQQGQAAGWGVQAQPPQAQSMWGAQAAQVQAPYAPISVAPNPHAARE